MDLALFQKAVAAQIGVTESSIVNWELGRTEPELCHQPAVIKFLGYDPRPKATPQTLAERIVAHRVKRGLSQKRFSKILGVDVTTLARWERGDRTPWGPYATKVAEVLEDLPPSPTDADSSAGVTL